MSAIEALELAELIRSEAATCSRPGQMQSLEAIADRVQSLSAEVRIENEAEFLAAPIGTVMRDRNRDVFVKVSEAGAVQTDVVGRWSASWVSYPAEVLS